MLEIKLTNGVNGNYVEDVQRMVLTCVYTVVMPQLGAAGIQNIGVRPGMMRIYSPGVVFFVEQGNWTRCNSARNGCSKVAYHLPL